MQVTKGTWRMREQCVPGSLSSSPVREPGNEASVACAQTCPLGREKWPGNKWAVSWLCRVSSLKFKQDNDDIFMT